MMTTNLQTVPYLPQQKNFPQDPKQLPMVIDKAYIEIAQRVNERTIGIYAVNFPVITGNSYFLIGEPRKQQSLRQFYTAATTANIPHGINFSQIDRIVQMYGTWTDGTNWYGAIAASTVAIAGQVTFYLDPNNIIFPGAPAVSQVNITIEWLSKVDTNS